MTQNNAASTNVRTRFLICSDTHRIDSLPGLIPSKQHADVAIHCRDLTTQSQLHEYKASIRLLQAINAPLKLVIAGNHDFTMDIPEFHKKVAEASLERELVEQAYGCDGDARRLFEGTGITFLDEGVHSFHLQNGALLTVYASPYTPSLGDWGFQYHPDKGHDFIIDDGSGTNVDVVMTHGPPKGILDYTHSGERAGSADLFRALARARPRMHCFGHIHEGWGARLITWRDRPTAVPSHLTDIDNGQSCTIAKLSDIKHGARQSLSGDAARMKCFATSHCSGDEHPLNWGSQTLFVNAAIEGTPQSMVNQKENLSMQLPWAVDLELRSSRGAGETSEK
ncbi:uncharacterized protein N7515_006983 [Penicillium bovifimosum]|uniref:Calcineurin-like phosphoesterase domain-containing protein n=1 Tax=Penicillium bovifimosum TaxID=126998 RepID=A0A9W9GX73_9EURO|nr:uncharacterized protein N7515_006983 [Penicillium bovifimosum]KAJ5130944.1 hypothetical protein N7515_006983 [Penicillium bovifimosum]